ncbi:MAG: hypothetical protein H7A12_02370 [Pseudomonadales bacterium]|nr:hypothetical protein [Pseudomonadales bacterium]MCP5337399.1 hypothetical protein [Pseudomonadales bacterium]
MGYTSYDIGKAEVTLLGSNPRFVVTSLDAHDWDVRALYEDILQRVL